MLRRVCKWLVFKCLYPLLYHVASLKKIKNKVIFVENHQNELSDNFTLIYQNVREAGYEISVHYLLVSSSAWIKIVIRSCRLIIDMATAKCVFISESNSLFGAFTLRRETTLVQLWHACGAFKKWGYSVADKSFGDDEGDLKKYSGHRNYSLVPVSGKAVCKAYEEAFGISSEANIVRPLGVSRTDIYFNSENADNAHKKLRDLLQETSGKKIILYAPTFRGDIKHARTPAELDINKFFEELNEEYILLIKQHPFVKEKIEIPEECKRFCFEIRDELSIEELLFTADILITDYSSVVFEYALLDKPILFFAYDLEEYYDERGFYYPYKDFVPGPVADTNEDLIHDIRHIDEFDFEKLEAFKNEYMSGCDGHSTERILKEVFGG